MRRSKMFLVSLSLIVVVVVVVGIFLLVGSLRHSASTSALSSPAVPLSSSRTDIPANAFVSGTSNSAQLSAGSSGGATAPAAYSPPPSSQVQGTQNNNNMQGAATGTAQLPLPVIPDSAIAIDPAGASTTVAFLSYFNANAYKGIVFDDTRFSSVLKDSNGVILFAPDLVNKALADGNFQEVRDSLLVQKDFVAAEINYLESIKVTGAAVAADKETLGTEELTAQLINEALAVGQGTISLKTFVAFYDQYAATISSARQTFAAQSTATAIAPAPQEKPWYAWITKLFGVSEATADDETGDLPFGGQIALPVLCPCDAGYWITVTGAQPASLFIPVAFMATPLFYDYRSMVPGAWWLGLYDPLAQVPCLVPPACSPVGTGGEIVMVGTSGA